MSFLSQTSSRFTSTFQVVSLCKYLAIALSMRGYNYKLLGIPRAKHVSFLGHFLYKTKLQSTSKNMVRHYPWVISSDKYSIYCTCRSLDDLRCTVRSYEKACFSFVNTAARHRTYVSLPRFESLGIGENTDRATAHIKGTSSHAA